MAGYKGKQGRKKKPKNLKVVEGTFRKDRDNPNQPKLKAEIPKPKKGSLTKKERQYYDRIAGLTYDMKVLTRMDVIALEEMSRVMREIDEIRKELSTADYVEEYYNEDGSLKYARKNPLFTVLHDLRKMLMNYLSRFGLEPSARASLNIVPEGDKTPGNEYEELQNNK